MKLNEETIKELKRELAIIEPPCDLVWPIVQKLEDAKTKFPESKELAQFEDEVKTSWSNVYQKVLAIKNLLPPEELAPPKPEVQDANI